jgi:hypothetical protein
MTLGVLAAFSPIFAPTIVRNTKTILRYWANRTGTKLPFLKSAKKRGSGNNDKTE